MTEVTGSNSAAGTSTVRFFGNNVGQWGKNSPEVSRLAAVGNYFRIGKQRHVALALIAEVGARGRTADEVEVIMRVPHQSASARINELHDPKVRRKDADGDTQLVQIEPFICASGERRETRFGRFADVYVVTEYGLYALKEIAKEEKRIADERKAA